MTEEILVHHLWTADDMLDGYRWHMRTRARRPFRYAYYLLIVLFIIVGVRQTFFSQSSRTGPLLLFLGVFIGFYLLFLQSWLIRRRFSKLPDRNTEMEWLLLPEVIQVRGPQSSSEFTWQLLSRVIQTPAGFLFYLNEQIFHWIPRRGFQSDADFDRLGQLAQQQVKEFRRYEC